ncbi:MAG TPA: PQQ-binding-like beta-propeller repeat protein, partial [Rhizomicrobium sp.]
MKSHRSSSPTVRAFAILAIGLVLLAGCANITDSITSIFNGGGKKSKLKGERISVMSLDSSLKVDPDLAKTEVVLPAPYRNPEWAQPGGFPSNATYHLEADGPLRQVWDQDAGKGSDTDSRLTAPPIVAGGRVYVLDAAAHVYVFSEKDGSPLWDKDLAPRNGTNGFTLFGLFGTPNTIDPAKGEGGGIAYDDDKLFVSDGFGQVFALDPADGRQLWKDDMGVPIVNAPTANGGRVFLSSTDNHFYALAESDGRTLWEHQGITESAGILESTSAAVVGEFVIAPYTSGEVYALRVQNGEAAWNDVLSHSGQVTALSELDDIAGRPVIDRDMVFVISHAGVMAAINLASGQRVWTRDIGGIQTPLAAGDYVYVVTTDAQIICLVRKDGRVRWIHQLPVWGDPDNKMHPIVWSGPLLVSNRLIVLSSSGYAEAISPYT